MSGSSVLADTNIILYQQTKNIVIEIRKNYTLKLPDAIVAATASYLDIPLITSDRDFRKIKEINIVFLAQ
jgi:predicted nucleic acid-binding protein